MSLVLATPRHSRLAAIVARMSCHKTRQEESRMYFLSFFPMEKCVIYCCRMHLRKCTTAQATCRCPSPCNLVALRKTMRHFKEEKDEPAILYSRTCYSKGLEQELQIMISCSAVHTYIKCMLHEYLSDVVDLDQKKSNFVSEGGLSACRLWVCSQFAATLPFFSLPQQEARSGRSFAATSGAGRPKSIISAATQTLIHPHRVSLTTYIAIELTLKSTETTFLTHYIPVVNSLL
jgi:hypothetical protein